MSSTDWCPGCKMSPCICGRVYADLSLAELQVVRANMEKLIAEKAAKEGAQQQGASPATDAHAAGEAARANMVQRLLREKYGKGTDAFGVEAKAKQVFDFAAKAADRLAVLAGDGSGEANVVVLVSFRLGGVTRWGDFQRGNIFARIAHMRAAADVEDARVKSTTRES